MNTATDNKHMICRNLACSGFPDAGHAVWEKVEKYSFVDVVTGEVPFLSTTLSVFRLDDEQALYLRFQGQDDSICSTFRLHDEPLYREDVFEAFIADEGDLTNYIELEVSPYDVHFDGMIRYDAQGERKLSMGYDIVGWKTQTVYDRTKQVIISVWKIPYTAFRVPPAAGVCWRVNFFRIDHSERGEALSAYQKTGMPSFHVPEHFGYLDFE